MASVPASIEIAVVDDDEAVRRALQRLLSSYGYKVRGYGTGDSFLESLATVTPVCVLLDLHMPGMSGFELQELLADQHDPPVPVIAITGHDDPETQARTRALGAINVLQKPVTADQLLSAIAKVRKQFGR